MPKAGPTFGQTGAAAAPVPVTRWRLLLAGSVIVLAVWAAYANSLSAPFVFDDLKSITLNPTIRQLWPPGPVLSPPPGGGLSGRPLVNLSFALNHAVGGEAVWGYHATNLAIHALAALTLFGVVRRTLLRPVLAGRFGSPALPLAWAVAVIWALHPLQTEAVTYLSQRTEALMGLCYLFTLYAFIRGVDAAAPARWLILAVVACWLGVASKEVMVTAPVLVLLYDRTLVAGTFREAWRQRWFFYLGLAGSWLLLAWLMRDLPSRQVGYGLGVTGWAYALTECRVVVHYLGLAVWPNPLVFDYGTGALKPTAATVPCVLLIGLLAGGTVLALRRRLALGFVAAWIFLILAPASSVVPVVLQPMAEHRMYLPLAGVVVFVVLGLHALAGRWSLAFVVVLATGLGGLTAQRNETYRSELALWGDTVAKRPDNARAQMNFATALAQAGRLEGARQHFAAAVRLNPGDAVARYNLGNVLLELNRPAEALAQCAAAVSLRTDFVEARNNLGSALAQVGRLDEAQEQFLEALRQQPDYAPARNNLAQLQALRTGPPGR